MQCGLEIGERAADEAQFPAVRLGAHWGEVLYREGDYVGTIVNVASRVAAAAGPHELLVTAAMREQLGDMSTVEFVFLGARTLKGISEDIDLYQARPTKAASRDRVVDPVCGMQLWPADVAATLDLGGETRAFCPAGCLQRFVNTRDRDMS